MGVLKDLFFPKRCVGCGSLGAYMCGSCGRDVEWRRDPLCIVCRVPSARGQTHDACRGMTPIDAYAAIWRYSGIMKRVIKQIKYRLAADAYEDLALMAARSLGAAVVDFRVSLGDFALVPVPLHTVRYRERGFNQAELIARSIGKPAGIPVRHVLERSLYTHPQAGLRYKSERRENVADAFRVRHGAEVRGAAFLIVDDLVTSGATTGEAARALKNAGARRIGVLALAQG